MANDEDSTLIDYGDDEEPKKSDDFISIIMNMLSNIPYKMAFLLFLVFILIMSDLFHDYILIQFDGAIVEGRITSYGHLVQDLGLVIFYIIFDALMQNHLI